jgi:hypothetical protein
MVSQEISYLARAASPERIDRRGIFVGAAFPGRRSGGWKSSKYYPLHSQKQHSNLLMLDMLRELNYGNFVMLLKSRAHFRAGMAIALRL